MVLITSRPTAELVSRLCAAEISHLAPIMCPNLKSCRARRLRGSGDIGEWHVTVLHLGVASSDRGCPGECRAPRCARQITHSPYPFETQFAGSVASPANPCGVFTGNAASPDQWPTMALIRSMESSMMRVLR